MNGLLVAGTHSDAGKSVLTAGICRWLRRRGVRVAPFKAQNMSNNSAICVDPAGRVGEIGRAQAMQAAACGMEPDVRFNPVLLKPGSDLSSQVVVRGQAVGSVSASNFRSLKERLAGEAFEALAELRREYEVVVCEGAGSPAEINLRDGDFVNMGLARAADLPVIVVGDIDRGGVFASLFGTLALLSAPDQAHVAGFVINRFRGDASLLAPGLSMLRDLTGRPTYGVLPFDLKAVYAELDFQAHDPAREFRPALRRHVHAQLLDRRSSLGEDVDDVEARAGGDGAEERFHRARRGLCRPVDDMLTSGGTGVEGAIAAPRDLAARDDRTAGAGWNREFLRRSTH